MRRLVVLVLVAASFVGCAELQSGGGRPPGSRELTPLSLGWERYLTVTWEATQARGRPVVAGYINNTSPYDFTAVRVLVDSLAADGKTVDQRIGWVPGDLRGNGRGYFEVPVSPAATYRVSVFSYDRLESASLMSSLR